VTDHPCPYLDPDSRRSDLPESWSDLLRFSNSVADLRCSDASSDVLMPEKWD
jgi:hypothetical protein